MKKLFKIIAWVVAAMLVTVVAAAIIVPLVIDPNDYRDEISSAVKQHTGRELTIDGEIELSLFPWLGVELGAMQLSNAQGFEQSPFARIGGVDVKVKLLPLFSGKVEMDKVVVHDLALSLGRRADGTTNWDDLVKKTEADQAAGEAQQKTAPGKDKSEAALAGLAIGGIELREAKLVWDDRQAGARYTIEHLNLSSGAVQLNAPFDLELEFDVDSSKPQMSGHIAFATRITLDLKGQRYTLDATRLSTDLQGQMLQGGKLSARLQSNVQADLVAQKYTLDAVDLSAELHGPLAPGGKMSARLQSNVQADLAAQTARVADLKLQVLDLNMQGGVEARNIIEGPQYSGQIKLAEFVPQDVLEKLAIKLPEMADPSVLTKAAASLEFSGGTDNIALKNIQLTLDASKLSGSVSVRNFARPALRYELMLDEIDADRYLPPPPPKDAPPPATPATAAAAGATQLPLEMMRALDIEGSAKVGKLKVMNLRSSELHATLKAKDGLFRVHPVGAKLYNGSYEGDLTLDVRGATALTSMDEKLVGVEAGPLLKDFMGKDYVSGKASVSAKLTARGIDPMDVRKSLNGTAAFSFDNGAVTGFNIAQLIRNAYATYQKQPAPKDEVKQTDFAEIRGTLSIKDGLVSNNDLTAKSPLFRVEGKGTAHLATEALDYLVKAAIVGTLEGQGGKTIDDLKGLTVPLRITGSFRDPKFNVELGALLDAKAKAAIEAEKKKLQQAVDAEKQKAQQEMNKKLQQEKKNLQKELEKQLKLKF